MLLKKLTLGITTMIISASAAFAIPKNCEYIKNKSFDNIEQKDIKCLNITLADSLNKNLPMRIDSATVWDTMIPVEDTLNYKYTVNINKSDIDKNKIKYFKKNLINQNCSSKTRTLLDKGIKILHLYHNKNGIFLFKVKVDSEVCKKAEQEEKNTKHK